MKKKLVLFIMMLLIIFTPILPAISHAELNVNPAELDGQEEMVLEGEGDEQKDEENSEEGTTELREEEQAESKDEKKEIDQVTKQQPPAVKEQIGENADSQLKVPAPENESNLEAEEALEEDTIKEVTKPNIILADFENGLGTWTVSGARYHSVDVSISNQIKRFGSGSLKIDYDFTNQEGTSGVYASLGKPIEIPGEPKKIGMWVYGDGEKHWLRQQLTDANGQNFNIDLTPSYPSGVTWEGWKYVEATIPDTWKAPFTLGNQAIRYMATSEQAKGAGTIYIDHIRAIYEDVQEDVKNPELSAFTPSDEQLVYTNKPEIAVIATDDDSGIDFTKTNMTVDGKTVTPEVKESEGIISYIPEKPLAEGLHTIWIEVFDKAGNHTFTTWTFTVETDGPSIHWSGDTEVYAGSTFDVDLVVKNGLALSGADFIINYDPNLLTIIDSDEATDGVQLAIPNQLKETVIKNEVNTETGEIKLQFKNLKQHQFEKETKIATLSFELGLDASGEFKLALQDGNYYYAEEKNEAVPFFLAPFKGNIAQPLTLEVIGKSVGTPSTFIVTDQYNEPVADATITVLGNQKLIEVIEPTSIYKGGSGIAGEPFEELAVGTIIPVANEPYSGFDFYRIFMPNGEQRYYHVPKEDVKEVDWGALFGKTNAQGEIKTEQLTISRIPIKLQATKDELVSQVESFTISPQLGKKKPENIFLTWTDDPKTTQHISWRTDTHTKNSIVEFKVKADVDTAPKQVHGNSELFTDPTGEMNIHKVQLTQLTPGTTYEYRVGDGSPDGWSDYRTFTTEADNKDAFRFLLFADTQAYDKEGFALFTALHELGLRKFPDTKFAVHAGDIVEEGNKLKQWEDFLEASQGLTDQMAMMMVLGNHDVYGNGANTYKSLFTYPQNGPNGKGNFVYSFDYGNARFIMLNSEFGVQDMNEQLAWIEEELQTADDKWTIVMFHRSPYKSNPKRGQDATVDIFAPLIEEMQVDLVLTGHDHAYMRTHPMQNGKPQVDGDGTLYIIGGSAGPKFYPGSAEDYVDVLYDEQKQLFTSLLVDGNTITIEAYTIDDELVDSFILEKREKTIAEKANLQALINEIMEEKLDEGKYTPDSWTTFTSSLQVAEDVLADHTATKKEINEARLNLHQAYEALQLSEQHDSDEDSSNDGDKDTNDDPSNDKNEDTDDESNDKEDVDSNNDSDNDPLDNIDGKENKEKELPQESPEQDHEQKGNNQAVDKETSKQNAGEQTEKVPATSTDSLKVDKKDNILPSTATNLFNLLLFGFATVLVGITIIVYHRFIKNQNNE
ncbi:3',5'-cyclic AMP phosphodiesterase CpdA [Pseudogracilibacillus auburnensis]|uniref:3',5'-cyclic AMP phosphodiesterase CpdA n=1 Tax=Pseudogracilibacillus auburnensis TaxID=1494959 RepID=A0A2V3W4W5_9BACI|nr:fibronectin type III domain-containing protein [Pseudogracilibacillus auburnensis]PXW89347.1 3',5'-cyclic AMP phosphodiesterase CpdA [Pseudogracilibacillus auburnensis]